jgi:hypothetical protein
VPIKVKEKFIDSGMASDVEVSTAVQAEATARASADSSLQTQINTTNSTITSQGSNLQSQITTNTNAIAAEVTNRTNADSNLQNQINTKYAASNPNGYETPAQLNTRDTNNRARANHTGTQLAATISDFASAQFTNVGAMFAESAPESSTTSLVAYTTKVSITTPSLVLGDYIIVASYKFRSATSRAATIRIVEGSNVLKIDEPMVASGSDYSARTMTAALHNVSGVKTIVLDFKVGNTLSSAAATAILSQASIYMWRIS